MTGLGNITRYYKVKGLGSITRYNKMTGSDVTGLTVQFCRIGHYAVPLNVLIVKRLGCWEEISNFIKRSVIVRQMKVFEQLGNIFKFLPYWSGLSLICDYGMLSEVIL